MGWYEDQVLPRAIDLMLGNSRMAPLRRRAMDGLSGTVLEIGFGSGTNVDHYPPEVERVLAVDPSTTGQRMAAKRLARSQVPVDFVGLDGAALALHDSSVDHALSTWTLCTIPDEAAALAEIARVLRPGGGFYFLEHGLADDARTARRQRRWNGVQQRIAGGCCLDRDHAACLQASPLRIERLDRFRIAGPRTLCEMYSGVARAD